MREMVGGCCVCSDERGWDENPLVYCDGSGCTVAVHQACYGIVCVPTGPWFCRKCEWSERPSRVRCELCPSRDGALKRTECSSWAHVVCALYIPEVRFGNVSTMEPIVLGLVPSDRYAKVCYLCEKQGRESKASSGACMQCNRAGCKSSFHVTCAQSQGLLCEEAGNYMDNVKYCGYCEYHYSKINKKVIKTIPAYKPVSSAGGSPSSSPEKPPPHDSSSPGGLGSSSNNSSNNPPPNLSTGPSPNNSSGNVPPSSSLSTSGPNSVPSSSSVGPSNVAANTASGSANKKIKKNHRPHRSTLGTSETSSMPGTSEPPPPPPLKETPPTPEEAIGKKPEDPDIESGKKLPAELIPNNQSADGGQSSDVPPCGSSFTPTSVAQPEGAKKENEPSLPAVGAPPNPPVDVKMAAPISELVGVVGSVAANEPSPPPPSSVLEGGGPVAKDLSLGGEKTLIKAEESVIPETPAVPETDEYTFVSHEPEPPVAPAPPPPVPEVIPPLNGGLPKRGVGRPPKKGTHLHASSLPAAAMPNPRVVSPPHRRPSPSSSPELESASSFKKKRKRIEANNAAALTGSSSNLGSANNSSSSSNGGLKVLPPTEELPPRSSPTTMWMMGTSLNPHSNVAKEMNLVLQNEISCHSGSSGPLSRLSGLPVPRARSTSSTSSLVFPPKKSSLQPQTLEELLERQWEQGSQFIMETAASSHFDIASLISSLNQLKEENADLESSVERLVLRREHLLAVRARLLALSMAYNPPNNNNTLPIQLSSSSVGGSSVVSNANSGSAAPTSGVVVNPNTPSSHYLNGPLRPHHHHHHHKGPPTHIRPLENGGVHSSATIIPVVSSAAAAASRAGPLNTSHPHHPHHPHLRLPHYGAPYGPPPGAGGGSNGGPLLPPMGHMTPSGRNVPNHHHLQHHRPMDKR